jgi:phosphotransferase system  glucose/maltose/N-acetylglucosamine-specific IIC component
MFFIGYVYLTVGLLLKFHRLALALLAGFAVGATVATAIAVIVYSEDVARWAETWQFYIRVLIVVFTVLFALWVRFDPENVREKDEEEEKEKEKQKAKEEKRR